MAMPDQDRTLAPPSSAADAGPSTASHVGPYRLVRLLGEGGFGEVHEAEQSHPIRRRVALKLIRPGMASRDILARFETERQALALMDHPHIARVYDAGTSEAGLPYFVMELVEGVPVTEYCNRHRLTVPERLAVFEQICQAMQHAHSKGVIHRDLKPGNVLVGEQDGQAFARVIDFGIARAIAGTLADDTRYTLEQQLIGTPLYMSPEQAEGSLDIDTRSDIYSLGVMLYELLTGATPIDALSLHSAKLAEVQRAIREIDPPRPSVLLGRTLDGLRSAGERCNTAPRSLGRQIRGDLDWIAMRALEKERARRYASVSELCQDVRRYLDGDPVLAAPPSMRYRIGKFVRRNRLLVGAGAAVVAALVLGVAIAAWQARIATRRADQLQQVASFQAEMLGRLDAAALAGVLDREVASLRGTRVDDDAFALAWRDLDRVALATRFLDAAVLAPSVQQARERFGDQPQVEASLSAALAQAYAKLGLYAQALPLRQRELDLSLGVGDRESAFGARLSVAELQRLIGDHAPAEATLKALLLECPVELGGTHRYCRESIGVLAALQLDQMRVDEAEPLFRQALAQAEAAVGADSEEAGDVAADLGFLLLSDGRLDEAEPLLRRALAIARARSGESSPSTLSGEQSLASLALQRGDFAAAEAGYRRVLDARIATLGGDHPDTLRAQNDLGVALHQMGRVADAVPFFEGAWRGFRAALGDRHHETLIASYNVCMLLNGLQRATEALPICVQASRGFDAELGAETPNAIATASSLAAAYLQTGNPAAAVDVLAPRIDAARTVFNGENRIILARVLLNFGRARLETGDASAAKALIAEGGAIIESSPAASAGDRTKLEQLRARLDAAR
jgi:serine/threonine protein kinase/tetratricopeptide (TPR) repeat protein